MTLGPIEVLVIGFPENDYRGKIIPEIQKLIDNKVINVVDGLMIKKDLAGEVTLIEFEQDDLAGTLAQFREVMTETVYDLLADEDVTAVAESLEPNSSAAVLVFEHRWAKPLRDAVVDAGGAVVANLRIPGRVVEEVLAASLDA